MVFIRLIQSIFTRFQRRRRNLQLDPWMEPFMRDMYSNQDGDYTEEQVFNRFFQSWNGTTNNSSLDENEDPFTIFNQFFRRHD